MDPVRETGNENKQANDVCKNKTRKRNKQTRKKNKKRETKPHGDDMKL